MSVSEVCWVCEAAEADHTCGQCGQLVCEAHFDDRRGLCVECASANSGPDESGNLNVSDDDGLLP